jgi:hypothetical protein
MTAGHRQACTSRYKDAYSPVRKMPPPPRSALFPHPKRRLLASREPRQLSQWVPGARGKGGSQKNKGGKCAACCCSSHGRRGVRNFGPAQK